MTDMGLSPVERLEALVQLLEEQQRVTVPQICERLNISGATARRYLEALEKQGRIRRVHGGAILPHKAPPELPVLLREKELEDEKQRIGLAVAEQVQDGETVLLGSGTTVLEVARALADRRNLTVITNSLLVMNTLVHSPEITLIDLGGMFRRSELSLIGHMTEQALAELRADRVIMGIRAIDVEEGLTNDYMPETLTDRAIIRAGRKVILVADHSKCGRVSTVFVAPVTSVTQLVTDRQTSPEFVEALRAQGVEVLVV